MSEHRGDRSGGFVTYGVDGTEFRTVLYGEFRNFCEHLHTVEDSR